MRRRAELVCSLAATSLGRDLSPPERTATDLAVRDISRRAGAPTIPEVIAALLDPDPASAAEVRTDGPGLAADGRQVALELRRLVEGDLAGMFDGPTSAGVDLSSAARRPRPVRPLRVAGPRPGHDLRHRVAAGCPGRG